MFSEVASETMWINGIGSIQWSLVVENGRAIFLLHALYQNQLQFNEDFIVNYETTEH